MIKKYPLYQNPYYTRFCDMIEGLAEGKEDQPAISWFTRKAEKQGVTLGQLRDDVHNLQTMLVEMGLVGKHIAVLGENCYEWLLVYFAATYCGAVVVCVDVEQPNETIEQMLQTADIDAIFYARVFEEICVPYGTQGKKLFLLSAQKTDVPTVRSLIEEGARLRADVHFKDSFGEHVLPSTPASIVFTSGTTNYAKPVVLSQEAILTNASDAIANVQIGSVAFTSLPFYHTYGMTCSVLGVLITGSQLYINGDLKTVMRDIQLAKPHTLLTVPLMLETIHSRMWMAAEEQGKADALRKLFSLHKLLFLLGWRKSSKQLCALREKCFGAIRLVVCGGAHMNKEIMQTFDYMGVQVLQGYGITECAPLVSVNRNKANKLDSVGLVSPNCEVKIVDGEILVRGKNVMLGYYNQPELTAEVMSGEWFCTGDMGELDKDGFLYITGRKKNLIVFKNGKKLSPEKLEEKVKKIPLVHDVVVYGAVSGESTDDVQVAASIFPDKEKTDGMASYEILEALQSEISAINRELPLYQQIQMITIREQEFSKTALQKIKRHLI